MGDASSGKIEIPDPTPPADANDHRARQESEVFGSRGRAPTLFEIGQRNEFWRTQWFRTALFVVAVAALLTTALALCSAIVVWALHLLLPVSDRWLEPEEVNKIQTILLSGALSSLATGAVTQYFESRKPQNDSQ